jgi:hypothetical protein
MSQPISLQFVTLPGDRRIAFSSETLFLVQVGKGRKGSYKTRSSFKGELHQALAYYQAISIGNGFKKRLLMPSCSKRPVIFRAAS